MGIIYCYTNKVNGKKYIGQTINPQLRYNAHKSSYQNPKDKEYDSLLHRAFRKYGFENFQYEILVKDIDSIDVLNELEIYYIKKFNCKTPNGYNETNGGDGGGDAQALIKWCQEHPEMVKRNRDNARIKAHQWQKDNKEIFSNIIRENQKKASEARKKKVKCIEKNIIFESASEAARQLNLSSGSHISAVCRGERKTAAGYHWEFIT